MPADSHRVDFSLLSLSEDASSKRETYWLTPSKGAGLTRDLSDDDTDSQDGIAPAAANYNSQSAKSAQSASRSWRAVLIASCSLSIVLLLVLAQDGFSSLQPAALPSWLPSSLHPWRLAAERSNRSRSSSMATVESSFHSAACAFPEQKDSIAARHALLDEAMMAAGGWPGRVDLMIRAFAGVAIWLQLMLRSIELFWPRNIGRVILVMDASRQDRQVVEALVPDFVSVYYEAFPPGLAGNGRWAQQWHDLWADNYTDADFIAIADTDSLFLQKVTPDLFFSPSGQAIQFLQSDFQPGLFDLGTQWWLGNKSTPILDVDAALASLYPLNFMQTLPVIFPVPLFPAFRAAMMRRFDKPYFDAVNQQFMSERHTLTSGEPSQFCILGNYWAYFSPEPIRRLLQLKLSDRLPAETLHELTTNATSTSEAVMRAVRDVTLRASSHVKWVYHDTPFQPLLSKVLPVLSTGICLARPGCEPEVEELKQHSWQMLTYANQGTTLWMVARHRLELVMQWVIRARQRWLAAVVQTACLQGMEAAVQLLTAHPTAIGYGEWQAAEEARQRAVLEQRQLNSSGTSNSSLA